MALYPQLLQMAAKAEAEEAADSERVQVYRWRGRRKRDVELLMRWIGCLQASMQATLLLQAGFIAFRAVLEGQPKRPPSVVSAKGTGVRGPSPVPRRPSRSSLATASSELVLDSGDASAGTGHTPRWRWRSFRRRGSALVSAVQLWKRREEALFMQAVLAVWQRLAGEGLATRRLSDCLQTQQAQDEEQIAATSARSLLWRLDEAEALARQANVRAEAAEEAVERVVQSAAEQAALQEELSATRIELEALRAERDNLVIQLQSPRPTPAGTESQQLPLQTGPTAGDSQLFAQWTAPELRSPPYAYPAPAAPSSPPQPREAAWRQPSPQPLGAVRQVTYPSYEPPIRSTLDATVPVATVASVITTPAAPFSGRPASPLGSRSDRSLQLPQAVASTAPVQVHTTAVLRQQSARLGSPVRRQAEHQAAPPMAPRSYVPDVVVASARTAAATPPVIAAPPPAVTARTLDRNVVGGSRGLTSRVHVHGPPGAPLSATPPPWLQAAEAVAAQGRRSPSASPERAQSPAPRSRYVLVADGASRPGCWSPPAMRPPGQLQGSPARRSPARFPSPAPGGGLGGRGAGPSTGASSPSVRR